MRPCRECTGAAAGIARRWAAHYQGDADLRELHGGEEPAVVVGRQRAAALRMLARDLERMAEGLTEHPRTHDADEERGWVLTFLRRGAHLGRRCNCRACRALRAAAEMIDRGLHYRCADSDEPDEHVEYAG